MSRIYARNEMFEQPRVRAVACADVSIDYAVTGARTIALEAPGATAITDLPRRGVIRTWIGLEALRFSLVATGHDGRRLTRVVNLEPRLPETDIRAELERLEGRTLHA